MESSDETIPTEDPDTVVKTPRFLVATVASHPDRRRVGDRATMGALAGANRRWTLSRQQPEFETSDGDSAPLAEPHISRKPIEVTSLADGIRIDNPHGGSLSVDGHPVSRTVELAHAALDRGIVLRLGWVVVVLRAETHFERGVAKAVPAMVGVSQELRRVRRDLHRLAGESVSVLIRGESGVGKELVARALHDLSRRQDAPFVALNMGTLAPGTGAAELFGHVKGAYTGATGDSVGAFGAAQGGTIFLDEIGDANMEIQVMLLRTLETGTIQPVGGRGRTHDIDVRVIAATDAHLETAIANGGFRLPLLHRLRGYEVVVSPLRERRDDIGPLLYNFLQVELERTGASELLDRVGPPWLHPQLAEKLVLYDYPGNVRELRNFIRQMVISSHDAPHAEPPSGLDPVSPSGAARAQSSPPPLEATSREARARAPDQISDEELEAVLARHRWEPTPAARDLGISTATIYQLMDRSPRVRVARSLTAEEVVEARRVAEGDIEAMADWLRVSVRALKRRITNLAK